MVLGFIITLPIIKEQREVSSNLGYCDLHLVTIANPSLTLNDYGRSN